MKTLLLFCCLTLAAAPAPAADTGCADDKPCGDLSSSLHNRPGAMTSPGSPGGFPAGTSPGGSAIPSSWPPPMQNPFPSAIPGISSAPASLFPPPAISSGVMPAPLAPPVTLSPSKIQVTADHYPTGELLAERRTYDGKLDGPTKEYYRNGQLMNLWNYSLGLLEGESTSYYRNGDVKTLWRYKRGKLHGETRHFYERRIVKAVETYKDGVMTERKSYGPNGDRLPDDKP